MRILFLLFVAFAFCDFAAAQLPKTDVFVAEFKNLGSKPQLQSVKYISGFNPGGYNNQAKFVSNDDLYLSVAIDTSRNTDIYHLDLKNQQYYIVTKTPQISEFSPILNPGKDRLTTVRIEPDGIEQSLWSYPSDRSNIGKRLFPLLKNVGYFTWINADKVAMFLVGNPHSLVVGDVNTGNTESIIDNVGRCLKTDANGNLLFVHKIREDLWMLKSFQYADKTISAVCQMPSNSEDFDVLANGMIITSTGSMIKAFNPSKDKTWWLIADFAAAGILNIQRPSVFRDRLLFINNKSN